jgi:hypothetical protein
MASDETTAFAGTVDATLGEAAARRLAVGSGLWLVCRVG